MYYNLNADQFLPCTEKLVGHFQHAYFETISKGCAQSDAYIPKLDEPQIV